MDSPDFFSLPEPPAGMEYKLVRVRAKTNWLRQMLSEGDGRLSVRRVVFFAAFVLGAAFCVAYRDAEISSGIKEIAITIITGAFGVMGVGRVAEALETKWEQ
jgi:hypothetical protein